MANIFQNIFNWGGSKQKLEGNIFNKTQFEHIGGQQATYDYDSRTYLEKGFGINPDVYSIVNQKGKKVSSIPFFVKEVQDKKAKQKLNQLYSATKGNYTVQQLARKTILENKAFSDEEIDFPLEEPNPLQTWEEIFYLMELYMDVIGNAYLYMVWAEDGMNAGVPKEVYLLPSHLVNIVLKKNANLIEDESPIDYYMLIEGNQFAQFPEQNVIHFKYPNPNFDFSGSHLYGLSPIKSVLRNIESSNDAINGNVKTMKNSGVFGFITSADKDTPFTPEQAFQIKEKLHEMDRDNGRLSKIAGGSAPIQFTRLSLDTDELKPFEFLEYDQKTIANVLGWSVMLLNSNSNMTYDNLENEKKRVLIDSIEPNLKMFAAGLNKKFIPRFKSTQNAEMYFDITEAPEMQEDYKMMVEWMDKAPLTENEKRTALKYETLSIDGMDVVWINNGKKRIDDVGITEDEITKAFRSE